MRVLTREGLGLRASLLSNPIRRFIAKWFDYGAD